MTAHAETVRGAMAADRLGLVLPHEHLFIDLRNQFRTFADPEKARLSELPVTMHTLGRLRRNPYALRDNLLLDDLEIAVDEAKAFKRLGGGCIIDCTSIGISRNPRALKALAERTDLHVIAGCGYYTHDTHPAEMDEWSVETIAAQMVRDLTEGMDGTGIRAGIIGEIGTSDPIHPNEKKSLAAAALAYARVPAPIYVHTYPWGTRGIEAALILLEGGVAARHIVICHVDVQPELSYIRDLLGLGLMVEFDNFGKEFHVPVEERGFAGGIFMTDHQRIYLLKQLIREGGGGQLLVTNDICLKSMLCHYGGWGYGHILEHIVPMMGEAGIGKGEIDRMLIANPASLFGGGA